MIVRFDDILGAFEFASSSGVGINEAFLCRKTGRILLRSSSFDFDELNGEEEPDDIEDDKKYLPIPDKQELDLGKRLVLDFARERLPNDFGEIRRIFSKRGAYQKFKALLARRNALDRWHEFESKATEQALRSWCEANSITLSA